MTAQLRADAGRLRVLAGRSGLRASASGRLRGGSWRLRLPRGFHPGCARKPDRWGIVSLVAQRGNDRSGLRSEVAARPACLDLDDAARQRGRTVLGVADEAEAVVRMPSSGAGEVQPVGGSKRSQRAFECDSPDGRQFRKRRLDRHGGRAEATAKLACRGVAIGPDRARRNNASGPAQKTVAIVLSRRCGTPVGPLSASYGCAAPDCLVSYERSVRRYVRSR